MKNFVEKSSTKFAGFYLTRWIWYKLCCRQGCQNIGKILVEIRILADIQKVKYWWTDILVI